MKKQDIMNIIDFNSILEKIFEQREEELYNITVCKEELSFKKSKNYLKIYTEINNIPENLKETKKCIEISIENYLETLNDIQCIEDKNFYKEGFFDAINLIIEFLNNGLEKK